MEKKIYTNEDITGFLLGALPDERTEYFDELSVTDDEFADRLQAAENDLVDSFARGDLHGPELERFNSFYLASPRRRQKAEFAKDFRRLAEKEVPVAEENGKKSLAGYLTALLTVPRFSLQWGLALASVALLLFGGWLLIDNARLRSEISRNQSSRDDLRGREANLAERERLLSDEANRGRTDDTNVARELDEVRQERERLAEELRKERQRRTEKREPETGENAPGPPNKAGEGRQPAERPPVIASFVLVPSLRSGNQLTTLSIPRQATSIALTLELETSEYAFYRAVLHDQATDRTVWQSGRLRSRGGGTAPTLGVSFPARILKSEIYSVRVEGVKTDGKTEIISDYPFRAVLK